MSFEDLDAGEKFIGKPVAEFTPKNILDYSFFMFGETFGYKMPVDGIRDIAILKKFVKTYGVEAPRVVKWMWFKHGGKDGSEAFRIGWFQAGHQWWIDQKLFEMKSANAEIKVWKPVKRSTVGFMNLNSLRGSRSDIAATA